MRRFFTFLTLTAVLITSFNLNPAALTPANAQFSDFELLETAPRIVSYGGATIADNSTLEVSSDTWAQFSDTSAPDAPPVPFDITLERLGSDGQYRIVRGIPDSDYAVPFRNEGEYTDAELSQLEQPWFNENGSGINVSRVKRIDLQQFLELPDDLQIENQDFERDFAPNAHLFRESGFYRLVFTQGFSLSQASPLMRTAHAQFGEPLFRYEQPFTVIVDGVPPDDELPDPPEQCARIFFDEGFSEPIFDCETPFGEQPGFPYEVTIADTRIEADGSYQLPLNESLPFTINPTELAEDFDEVSLFQHQGEDFIFRFEQAADTLGPITFTATGTYTLVLTEAVDFISLSDFLPTVQAQGIIIDDEEPGFEPARFALTFTVTATPEPEPTGASSVLFLPGIQASRLYAGEDIPVPGLLNDIEAGERLWEPGNNNDVRALAMTEAGESVNDVYTRDVVEEVLGVANIYEGLLEFLDEQKALEIISDWHAYPYDWRFDVVNIAQNGTRYQNEIVSLIETVERLAEENNSQVTILAHSNGGLLAKALMIELEKSNKEELIDRIIFLASPQTGTPKALGTLLHGLDQGTPIGIILSQDVARSVVKNLPGLYGLLPSQTYFDSVDQPVITIQDGEETSELFEAYGSDIDSLEELRSFIRGDEGRDEPGFLDLENPALGNDFLYEEAIKYHADLDVWTAPESVEVVEIVGTGLATLKEIQYRSVLKTVCSGSICAPFQEFEPFGRFDLFGDETVAAVSASSYVGDKRQFFVDLRSVDLVRTTFFELNHANIGEIDEVQNLLGAILEEAVIDDINFVSQIQPSYSGSEYKLLSVHSPVTLKVTDLEGNETSVDVTGKIRKTEIPGSQTFVLASSTYLFIPADIEYEAEIEAYEEGSYGLLVETLTDGTETRMISELQGATVTAQTIVSFSSTDSGISNLETDFDGDGEIDVTLTPDGEMVQDKIDYEYLVSFIKTLDLSRFQEKRIIRIAWLARHFDQKAGRRVLFARLEERMLGRLEKIAGRYERRGLITTQEFEELLSITAKLKNND